MSEYVAGTKAQVEDHTVLCEVKMAANDVNTTNSIIG